MMRKIFDTAKRQRLTWTCSVLVGLFLTMYGHAPVLPVAAGCLLAVGFSVLRAWPAAPARGSK